jgi:hypothetical protein
LINKEIPTEDMMMKMLASRPLSCVTSWQAYGINGYTYYTKEKGRKSVAQNSDIRIEVIDPQNTENHVLWVHTEHMGTRLRLENTNTHLQVPMDKTTEWCERRQLRTYTG